MKKWRVLNDTILLVHLQGSPEIMEVKMGTESFSNSGNEGSDENDHRRSDNDEVTFELRGNLQRNFH